jgi:periplasmic copper chaperone A
MTLFRTMAPIAALLLCVSTAGALDYQLGPLKIEQPWMRATPRGAAVAGGYLKITNTGSTPDRLIGGTTVVADRFEIHEMATVDGVMKMRPLPAGLEIKPGETVELKPGSFHLMFTRLKQPVVQGKAVKGTLVFEKAGTVDVEYAVEAIGGAPGGHHH